MKPKNIMLLGFVNRAVDYLDKHLDDRSDPTLTELKNIDLVSLKNELSENLGFSFGSIPPEVDSLMSAGEDVFDQFIDAHGNKETLSEELGRMLDVDFDNESEKEDKPVENSESDLDRLLAFYNLDGVFTENESEIPDIQPDTADYQAPYEEVEIPEQTDDEKNLFKLTDEDNELLQQITENVNKVNNGESINQNDADYQSRELDSIFNEVLAHEDIAESEEEKEKIKKKAEVETEASDGKKDEYIDELFRYFDDSDTNISPYGLSDENKPFVSSGNSIDKDDIIRMVQDLQASRENLYKEDELFADNTDNTEENPAEEFSDISPIHDDDSNGEEDDVYTSGLIDELRMKMMREDQERESLEQELRETSEHIREIYPYLSVSFIMGVCSMKDAIANEYLTVNKVIDLERLSSKDVENLRQCVEITLKHDYQINADEKKQIVDAIKECENTEEKIISSIFDIANQAALLNGEYEGYRIMSEEEL